MEHLDREPAPDPRLGAALRDLDPSPAAEVDWERLRASVAARAELPLARRRRAAGARRASGWARVVVPAAAAAGIAFAVNAGALRPSAPSAGSGPRVAVDSGPARRPGVEELVYASYPAQEVDRWITGRADAEALLGAAVGEGPAEM